MEKRVYPRAPRFAIRGADNWPPNRVKKAVK